MDGVLVDFANAALEAHGVPGWFSDNPDARGDQFWDIPENLGITDAEFWEPLKDRDIWANLAPMKDGFIMLCHSHMNVDASLYCLTYPFRSEGCYAGKFHWFMKHLADMIPPGHYMTCKEKHLAAHNRNCILVDDNTQNCRQFVEAGGRAFLVGRPWNKHHWKEDVNVPAFADFIERIADEQPVQTQRGW